MRKSSLLSSSVLLACGWLSLFSVSGLAQAPSDEEPKLDDFAGIWKASEGTLYTTDGDQAGVLAALGAKSEDGRNWTAPTYNTDGTLTQAAVRVVLVDPSLLLAFFPSPGDPIPCPHPNHILYRNSICGYVHLGFSGICQMLPGNTSQRTSYNSYRSCRRQIGPTYCVDVRSVIGWTQSFYSGNCTGPISNMQMQYGWTCQ
jgi:hypothetical protein